MRGSESEGGEGRCQIEEIGGSARWRRWRGACTIWGRRKKKEKLKLKEYKK
jgi:hypothetical protein